MTPPLAAPADTASGTAPGTLERPATGAARRTAKGVCPHDCPDTCAVLVEVEGEKVVRVHGDPSHPVTRGFLCNKVNRYAERLNHPERLLHPQIRTGPKGSGTFRRASWDEALDLVAKRLTEVKERHGGQAILPYRYAGTMGVINNGTLDRRFFHALGASRLEETICATAGAAGFWSCYGSNQGPPPESIPLTRLVVLWGANVLATSIHDWPFIEEARAAGAKLVVIDPLLTPTAERADWHIRIRPGTDAAFALSVAHEIFAHGWHDEAWLDAHALGWEDYRERAATCPPERAALLTGVPADEIRRFAALYAAPESRPALVRLNYGLNRHANGATMVRAVALLPSLVGDWARPGGGARLSTSAGFALNRKQMLRLDLEPHPTRSINMTRLGEALLSMDEPRVMALFVYSANPAASNPDQRRVHEGLAREDLFTVVHEQFPTDTARYADVLLPSTMQMEHSDLHYAYGHYHMQLNRPAVPAPGECRPLLDLFRELAKRMGITDPCFDESFEDLVRIALDNPQNPRLAGITLERLEAERSVPLTPQDPRFPVYTPFLDGHFDTPSKKVEFVSSLMKTAGVDPVLGALTAEDADPEVAAERARWPLHFVSPASRYFINSSMVENERGRRMQKGPLLYLSPADASARGITSGDRVRVWNDRGEWVAVAEVGELTGPGVVATYRGWWSRYTADGRNANQTTSQRLTDAGAGATFYSTFVEVEKSEG
ncbi:MAG: molybdopterin-containing oxidoreductase family protein [Candidatus Eiseniibacteriota bacterium]